jgi:hypothetical protein
VHGPPLSAHQVGRRAQRVPPGSRLKDSPRRSFA